MLPGTTLTLVSSITDLHTWLIGRLQSLPSDLSRRAAVVLPSVRIAHQIRRRVCVDGHAGLLAGVTILSAEAVAHEVLIRAGIFRAGGLVSLRTIALQTLFTEGRASTLRLAYLDPDQLQRNRGYAEAIAATIAEVELAGIGPADLCATAEGWRRERADEEQLLAASRVRDTATLWQAVDDELRTASPDLRSTAQRLAEAADALRLDPSLATPLGPIFVVLPPQPSTVTLRFLAALGVSHVALFAGRPVRILGEQVVDTTASTLGTVRPHSPDLPPGETTELHLIHSFLFAPPDVLARPDRRRSRGPDGSVVLEQYPGIQDEIDAAVGWALEQVIERRTPLEEIAIIVAAREVVPFLAAALERADKGPRADRIGCAAASSADTDAGSAPLSGLPTYVAGGLPLVESPSGRLLLQLLRALHTALEAEQTIPLLAHLRLAGDSTRGHLSESDARRLTYACGIIGGTPSDPRRAAEWSERLANRARNLDRQLAVAADDTGEESEQRTQDDREKAKWVLGQSEAAHLRTNILAILPAVETLSVLAAAVRSRTALPVLWPAILGFYRAGCRVPPEPPDAARLLAADLSAVCAHQIAEQLRGGDAVAHVIARLCTLRHPHGRFGEPRIFVGTPQDALGLTFRAVRILGAVEGALPASPREDPILPDRLRAALQDRMRRVPGFAGCIVPTSSSAVLRQTHDVFFAATAASGRLALSAPRQWIDGTDREIAGLVLEAVVALGRPDDTGTHDVIPSLTRLRHDYIAHGVNERRRYDRRRPASTPAVLRTIAEREPVRSAAGTRARAVPLDWCTPQTTADPFTLPRLHAVAAERKSNALALSDGVLGAHLGAASAALPLPGLGPERAISASGLVTLLVCPHRFLLERVLHLDAPVERPAVREIGQPHYGALVHRVMERFFRAHGPHFCQQDGSFTEWARTAAVIVDRCFEEFCAEYPLLGTGIAGAQRERLRRDVSYLLEAEWETHLPLTFVGVEVPFGFPPEAIALRGGHTLYVHGFIDRVDLRGHQLMVRDIKTGRAKRLREAPTQPAIDMQLALYALVAPRLPEAEGARVAHAAYTYPAAQGDRERPYASPAAVGDRLANGRAWLELAATLLRARSFPHAANTDACTYCPFRPVCGDDAPAVSRRKLATADDDSPERAFGALQGVMDDGHGA